MAKIVYYWEGTTIKQKLWERFLLRLLWDSDGFQAWLKYKSGLRQLP